MGDWWTPVQPFPQYASGMRQGAETRVVRRRAWWPVRCQDGRWQWLRNVYYLEKRWYVDVLNLNGKYVRLGIPDARRRWLRQHDAPMSAAGLVAWRLTEGG